jgi:endoglucanase
LAGTGRRHGAAAVSTIDVMPMPDSTRVQRNRLILHEVLSLPTAPFAEHMVIDYVRRFVEERPVITLRTDASGNLLLHVRRGRRSLPRVPCLTAHMDHPGFVAERMVGSDRLRAWWRGGVPPEYFAGSAVRFRVDRRWIPARIESTRTVREFERLRVDSVVARVGERVPGGSIGMWDFPDPRVRGTRIHARGCDDLAGLASILCALDELACGRDPCEVYALFTRAEEVGFVGAIAAARRRTVPRSCYLVCMETSSQRPHARIGDGPILRVGDKASVFTPAVTAHVGLIADDWAKADSTFSYQRKLMDGGTCESSAFCTFGYDATGVCLALGNYHNVDARRKRLAAEFVDLGDFDKVVDWFIAVGRSRRRFRGGDDSLKGRLTRIEKAYARLLARTTKQPA